MVTEALNNVRGGSCPDYINMPLEVHTRPYKER